MKNITVTNGTYISGNPALDDRNINFSDLSIKLSQDKFNELCAAISNNISQNNSQLEKFQDKVEQRAKDCSEFLKEIRAIFYEMDDDYGFRRENIDKDALDAVLNKYARLLGFE